MLVLDNETDPDHRYLGRAIAGRLDASYRVYPDDPGPVDLSGVEGVVLSGSSASVYEAEHEPWTGPQRELIRDCITERVPLLGICFGHQLVNDALGGTVEFDGRRARLVRMTDYETGEDGVLGGVDPTVPVVHGDVVTELGEGMRSVGTSGYDPNFCARHREAPIWTVQFHPEIREAFVPRISGWEPTDAGFEACNAVRVLDNFARIARTAGER